MPLLVNRQAMRALFHAVPQADDEVAQVEWDQNGFHLSMLDQANVVLSRLTLTPEAFAEGLTGNLQVRVLAKHLRGALNTCVREDQTQAIKVDLSPLARGLQVRVMTPPNKITRKLAPDGSPPIKMTTLPSFTGAPSVAGLPAGILDDGLTALALLDLDYIILQLSDKGVKMEGYPELIPAVFEHSTSTTTAKGSSRVSQGHLRAIADFGARHGIQPQSLTISLLQDGLMMYEYTLESGTMTYWVAPRMAEN